MVRKCICRSSVCLLPRFLPQRARNLRNSDSNGFSATQAWFNTVILIKKILSSKVMVRKASEQANCKLAKSYLDRVRLLCVPWRHKKSQRTACVDSRILSTTVASPCQTLRELSGRPQVNTCPVHQLAVSRMRSLPRVCTLVIRFWCFEPSISLWRFSSMFIGTLHLFNLICMSMLTMDEF